MVKYSLGIGVMFIDGKKDVSRRIGVNGAEYSMLSYLSGNDEEATISIIENLEKVIAEELDEYGPWGADFCVITSYKEVSKIEHYDFGKDDWDEHPLYTDMPTAWLLAIMKDWAIFLKNNPRELYS